MTNAVRRFFGGSPGWVILRLVIVSLAVGIVLSALEIDPTEIVRRMERLVRGLWDMGFEAVLIAGRWIALGAMVVIPIWLVLRVLNIGRRGR